MEPKDIKENFNAVNILAKDVVLWFSKTAFRKFYLIILIQLLIILPPYFYLEKLIHENDRFSEERQREIVSISKVHDYQITIDLLNVCINTKDLENRSWYCDRAEDRYVRNSKGWPQSEIDLYLDKNLYEGMIVDVSHYKRSLDFDRLIRKEYKNRYQMDLMLSRGFLFLLLVVSSFSTVILFKLFRGQ